MNTHKEIIIIGAGISGLTISKILRDQIGPDNLLILEKSSSAGGMIRTHSDQGYISEVGPHGFLDNCKESQSLLKRTGLDTEVVKAPLKDFVRYVYLGGKLNLIPQTPFKILRAPLISWREKLRVLTELWTPPLTGNPSVAKWVNHRFGPALLPFADAVFTGTYAGDMNQLSMDAVMPGARRLELEHGSLIRGLVAKMRKAKKEGKISSGLPSMTSFPQGMFRLPQKLAEDLQEDKDILYNCGVQELRQVENGWALETEKGSFITKDLILALSTNASLSLLKTLASDLPLNHIPETHLATIAFGFDGDNLLPPGFGFLTPEQEKRFSLGTLFSSNMFSGRAPSHHCLVETLVGGRRHPERLEMSDPQLIETALKDVQEILKIEKHPVYAKVMRSWGGIPQLERGYPELLSWRDELCQKIPNLHICGFGWEGIGLNDMIKTATRVANEVIAGQRGEEKENGVKAVYF